jgi:uncharacterized membrane protein
MENALRVTRPEFWNRLFRRHRVNESNPIPVPKHARIEIDAHHRFFASCVLAALAFLGLHGHSMAVQVVAAWDVFAFATVALALVVMVAKDPYEVRRNARLQDASQTFLFVVVISGATASLFAVFILLGAAKNLTLAHGLPSHVALAVGAVVQSWALVHTLFALRYAHLYYVDAHKVKRDDVQGGLIFPEDKAPDYFDFLYFSFIIGMTCQVSDVQISHKRLRRLATVHGLIAFAFNTAILALFVNIVAGLI